MCAGLQVQVVTDKSQCLSSTDRELPKFCHLCQHLFWFNMHEEETKKLKYKLESRQDIEE